MTNANRSAALVLSCLIGTIASSALGQDWPQWRGSNRDAKVSGFTPPQQWPKTLAQKWKTAVGDGVATPALVGDRLYVFARREGNEVISCLDAESGKELWQDKYPALGASGPASGYSGPRASPAVAEGKVVTLGIHGVLSCLDAATGKKLWRKDDFPGSEPKFSTSSSPVIIDGLCIAQLGGPGNGGIVAYDLASGDQKWKWTGDGPAYASPALMSVGDARLLIAETDQKIVAINIAGGTQVWETPFAAQGPGGYNAGSPIVDGQSVIYSGGKRGTRAVKIDKEGTTFSARELWNNPETAVLFNSPIAKDGLVYGLTQANEVFCINEKTGQTAWTAAIGPAGQPGQARPGGGGGGAFGRPGGRRGGGRGGFGVIVDAGPVLLALTSKSELVVFQPGEKAFTELARIKVADSPTYAYPVISGKRVFIKDQDSVTLLTIE